MSSEVEIVLAGDTKETTKVAKQPTIVIDPSLQSITSNEQRHLITKDEKGVWKNETGVYYAGTVVRVKTGQDIIVGRVDPEDKKGIATVVKAYIQSKLLRAFGWREVKGARVPRIEIAVNGNVSSKWGIPKPEEGQTAEAYVLQHGKTLRALRDKMVQTIFLNHDDDVVFQTCLDDEAEG